MTDKLPLEIYANLLSYYLHNNLLVSKNYKHEVWIFFSLQIVPSMVEYFRHAKKFIVNVFPNISLRWQYIANLGKFKIGQYLAKSDVNSKYSVR